MKTLDVQECADFLKINRTHVLKLLDDGKLPGAKIGRCWVFIEEDVAAYLRAEIRDQMRERQGSSEQSARPPMLVAVKPAGRQKRALPDLSGYDMATLAAMPDA